MGGDAIQTHSCSRPSASTDWHIMNAYCMMSGRDPESYGRNFKRSHFEKAADVVERLKADPYEYMRILFREAKGGHPYVSMLGSDWARDAYTDAYGNGPSIGLRTFLARSKDLARMVFAMGVPFDSALGACGFCPLVAVVFCSEHDLLRQSRENGEKAADMLRWDRELKHHIKKSHAERSERIFR